MSLLFEKAQFAKLVDKLTYLKILCACMLSRFSHVQLFEALWTVDHQAPLSMSVGFSRQEYCSGLSYPPPGESSQSRDQTQVSCLAGGFFTPEPPGEAQNFVSLHGVTERHDWGTEMDWTHSIYLFLHSYASKNHLSCDQLVTIIIVFLKNRVWLLYNVVLASAVQWSESAMKSESFSVMSHSLRPHGL